jgi:hypothetical protein
MRPAHATSSRLLAKRLTQRAAPLDALGDAASVRPRGEMP